MARRLKIGDHFYLWTPASGLTRTVTISSHGAVLAQTFIPPQGTLFKYYSPPTRSAYGTLEKTLYEDQVKDTKDCSHARAAWNATDDYALSKFQGKHGGNFESYGDIKTFVDKYDISVLSVRNRKRWWVKTNAANTYLSRAIGLIEARHPGVVREYRCLFCRVELAPVWYRDALTGEAFTG